MDQFMKTESPVKTDAIAEPKSEYQHIYLKLAGVLLAGIGVPLGGGQIITSTVGKLILPNEPLHSVIEVGGSIIAFVTVTLINLARDDKQDGAEKDDFTFISNAFIGMGILDMFHA